MNNIEIYLGIIIGMLASLLIVVSIRRYEPKIQTLLKQMSSKVQKKGSIIEPENEELRDWVDKLPNK